MTKAFVTLVTSEAYVAGALVLAQTLKKEHKTKYPVAVLLDPRGVGEKSEQLLRAIFDAVVPIDGDLTGLPAEVEAKLGRPELAATYAKILVWNTNYDQVVYLDSDTLPLKNIDKLFDEYGHIGSHEVAASPDIGWPDIFNSGLLVLKPDPAIFNQLKSFAKTHESFDGADQGLLNEFFHLQPPVSGWHRLPFVFNVTPSDNYQYLPALTRFYDQIHLVHFIGATKPWSKAADSSKFTELWWAKFNKYYTDETTRIGLLNINTIRGEAHALDFPKGPNTWDDVAPVTESLSRALVASKVFPWEERERPAPTRVFNQTYEGQDAPKESDNFADSVAFNPDESLDRISKLPIQLLSKKRGDPSNK